MSATVDCFVCGSSTHRFCIPGDDLVEAARLLALLVGSKSCYYGRPLMTCRQAGLRPESEDRHPDSEHADWRAERPCLICRARKLLGMELR